MLTASLYIRIIIRKYKPYKKISNNINAKTSKIHGFYFFMLQFLILNVNMAKKEFS